MIRTDDQPIEHADRRGQLSCAEMREALARIRAIVTGSQERVARIMEEHHGQS